MKNIFTHTYNNIISVENLLGAWQEFLKGKRSKKDVQEFQYQLLDNVIALHQDLKNKTYTHSSYYAFNISDPKPRNIHKASVRDRLLHHAIYRVLYPFFDKTFISDSYSCRKNKGTHRALSMFRNYTHKLGQNHTKTCWVLKCDVKKFFASIDHDILKKILADSIQDEEILWLLGRVIDSFHTNGKNSVGLPLGNLTSQLLVNIYMNEFDQWMKHRMKVKYYIRYADDFAIMSQDKDYLLELTPKIADFLEERLRLTLHPDKVFIKTIASGVDFLGWVHFSDHRILRTSTRRRMMKKLKKDFSEQAKQSYLGMLEHGNTYKIKEKMCKPIK